MRNDDDETFEEGLLEQSPSELTRMPHRKTLIEQLMSCTAELPSPFACWVQGFIEQVDDEGECFVISDSTMSACVIYQKPDFVQDRFATGDYVMVVGDHCGTYEKHGIPLIHAIKVLAIDASAAKLWNHEVHQQQTFLQSFQT